MTGAEIKAAKRLIDQAVRRRINMSRGIDGALARSVERAGRHGVSMYRHGCRCEVCRSARASYERQRIAKKFSSAAGAEVTVAKVPAAKGA